MIQHQQQHHHHHKAIPKRIILVRHGESQGNLDGSAYTTTPDYKIPLTQVGIAQAHRAGAQIRRVISDDGVSQNWKVYFYVSPYERTRSTLRQIGRSIPRERIIGVREECRIREQDFGNFQEEQRMKVIKETRERFGRFFYRFPEGESAADVYDRVSRLTSSALKCKKSENLCFFLLSSRDISSLGPNELRFSPNEQHSWISSSKWIVVSYSCLELTMYTLKTKRKFAGFLESLWRDIDMNRLHHDPSDDLNLIIVSHGLASRVFLTKWFKWTVEQFEYLNNPENCEFRVMQLGQGGEYSLAVHHTDEELQEWGLSSEMIADQKWRARATKGDWNENCPWYLDEFFDKDSEDSGEGEHDDNKV